MYFHLISLLTKSERLGFSDAFIAVCSVVIEMPVSALCHLMGLNHYKYKGGGRFVSLLKDGLSLQVYFMNILLDPSPFVAG